MLVEPDTAHRYGMTKMVATAASAWADWDWSSLDAMTTGVTAPSVMAVRTPARVFARSMSSWCVAGSGPSRPGPGQQLAAHPVQLTDVAPAKAAQEGAQSLPSRKRGVEGALAVKPRTRAVPPARSASASLMQSPPANAEATSVIILSPVLARPGASPRSKRRSTSWGRPRCKARVDGRISPALATRRWSSKVIWIRSGWWRGSSYGCSLFWGRFAVAKPLSQKHLLAASGR